MNGLSGIGRTVFFAFVMCGTANSQGTSAVPIVGCKSDGQTGPRAAPNVGTAVLPISVAAAQRLAYYKMDKGFGVLAPRGWQCFGTYGSSGEVLYVGPQAIDAAKVLSTAWKGFPGPAVEIARSYGDTPGRFEVAKIIARVFPAHRAFVDKVAGEGLSPAKTFSFGPYLTDRLTYRSKEMVEYQTPAQTDGLGTASHLQKGAGPITGAAILTGAAPDLVLLSVRLPANIASLTIAIIQEAERAVAQLQK